MTYSLPGAHTTEQPVKDLKKKSLQIKGGLGFGSQCLSETGLTNTEAHGEGYVVLSPLSLNSELPDLVQGGKRQIAEHS